jgi:hypothetical protein
MGTRACVLAAFLLLASPVFAVAQERLVWGLQAAYGAENDVPHNPDNSHIKMLYAQPQIGVVLWDSPTSRLPIKRFEILTEGIVGGSTHPGGHLIGDTLMFRFSGNLKRRYAPYFNLSSGPLHTTVNERAPELGGHIQFLSQGGAGIQRHLTPRRSIVAEYRYFHMSNASLETRNHGFNGSMLSVGMRWTRAK